MAKLKWCLLISGILVWIIRGEAMDIFPQAGMEYYFGANKFRSFKPWLGLRMSLSPYSSLLVKYTHHDLSFNYPFENELLGKREANLSQFIGALYYSKEKKEAYIALSYFRGTDDYTAWNVDSGGSWQILTKISLEGGFYFLDENSVLWYPYEPNRRIKVGALRGGININLNSWIKINPLVYVYRTSEKVKARTLVLNLIITPHEPFCLTVTFWDYRESAEYRFSGQYVSIGIHLYY